MEDRVLQEAREIREALEVAVAAFNAEGGGKSLDNVYVNEITHWPSAIGCFWDPDRGGWMDYSVGDRFELNASGPYSKDGVIRALAVDLFIPKRFVNREFTEEEYDLFLSGQRPYHRLHSK